MTVFLYILYNANIRHSACSNKHFGRHLNFPEHFDCFIFFDYWQSIILCFCNGIWFATDFCHIHMLFRSFGICERMKKYQKLIIKSRWSINNIKIFLLLSIKRAEQSARRVPTDGNSFQFVFD